MAFRINMLRYFNNRFSVSGHVLFTYGCVLSFFGIFLLLLIFDKHQYNLLEWVLTNWIILNFWCLFCILHNVKYGRPLDCVSWHRICQDILIFLSTLNVSKENKYISMYSMSVIKTSNKSNKKSIVSIQTFTYLNIAPLNVCTTKRLTPFKFALKYFNQ